MSDITVKFGAQDENLSETLTRIQRQLGNLEDKAEKSSSKFDLGFGKIAGAAAVADLGVRAAMKGISLATDAAAAVMRGFAESIELGGRLADLSKRTGETAGNLLILERAFNNTGVGADKVGPTINRLQKFMEGASDASSKQGKTLAELGLSYEDLAGKAPTEQMRILADRIANVQDPAKKTSAAMSIFGKAGGQLLPIFADFNGELQGAKNQLGSLPDIMTRSSANFDRLGDSIDGIKGKTMEFAAGILETALPAISDMTEELAGIDAAGIGQKIGEQLGLALAVITDGNIWEIFRLHAEKAINAIQTSDAINGLSATLNTIFDGITDGSDFDWDATFQKYSQAGQDANTEIADNIDTQIQAILTSASERVKAQQKQLAENAANEAAKAAIMLQGIQEKAGFTKEIPAWLKRVEGIPGITEEAKNDLAGASANAAGVRSNLVGAGNDMKENTGQSADNMNQIRTLGDLIAAQNAAAPMKKFNEQVKEARADLKSLKDFIGGDFSRLSIPDIAKKLGIETANKDQRELFSEIKKEIDEYKNKEINVLVNKDATKESLEAALKEVKTRMEVFGDYSTIELNMTAEKSIAKIKDSLKQEVDVALSSSQGTKILEAIKTAVDVIKTTVQAIEPKLPQTALGV